MSELAYRRGIYHCLEKASAFRYHDVIMRHGVLKADSEGRSAQLRGSGVSHRNHKSATKWMSRS